MEQALLDLGRARSVDAAPNSLALLAHRLRAAGGACRWHDERDLVARAPVHYGLDHLRDDITRTLDENDVAYEQALPPHLTLVVQRGPRNRDTAYLHGLEHGDGRQSPRPADLDADVQQLRRHLLWWELVGDRPAGVLRCVAQPPLLLQRVDFDDHAVHLESDGVPPGFPGGDVLQNGIDVVEPADMRAGLETSGPEFLQALRVGLREGALAEAESVEQRVEGA